MFAGKKQKRDTPKGSFVQTREWLLTNGLGGYSIGTSLGIPLQRGHTLLTLPLRPPLRRAACLRTVFDAVLYRGTWCALSPELIGEKNLHKPHPDYKLKFTLDQEQPAYRIIIGALEIVRTFRMVPGENALYVAYRLLNGEGTLRLRLAPAWTTDEWFFNTPYSLQRVQSCENGFSFALEKEGISRLYCQTENPLPFQVMNHVRRLCFQSPADEAETVWCPAALEADLRLGQVVTFRLGLEEHTSPSLFPGPDVVQKKLQRALEYIPANHRRDELLRRCAEKADAYLITRPTRLSRETRTLLAGYPAEAETGFDTLIGISGLLLPTGRFQQAVSVLDMLRRHEKDGMVPDCFSEEPEQPSFTRMDTSLWYVQTVYDIWKATGDEEFVEEQYSFLLKILNTYLGGTRTGVSVDSDGMVMIGEHALARSWMDAQYQAWEATPRVGKPVEVQMLWYNALMVISEFSRLLGKGAGEEKTSDIAAQVRENFTPLFWLPDQGYLADVLHEGERDPSLRCNQVIGLGLPFVPVTESQARSVLAVVDEHLLTPMGVRTLSPHHPAYHRSGEKHAAAATSALYNGVIHTWLLWPYVRLALRCGTSREKLKNYFSPLFETIGQGVFGHVHEQFSPEAPHHPQGLPASLAALAAVTRTRAALLD